MFETIKNKVIIFFDKNDRLFDLYAVSNRKINKLIIKFGNDLYLISRKCPHNGLPLTNSIISKDIITCNWHGCRFSLFTNEIIPRENLIKYKKINKENFNWLKNELSN